MTPNPPPTDVLPGLAQIWAVLTLQAGYNTSVVMIGVALLGLAAGTVGTFALLRKRALMSDTLSHATLPGIAGAFLVAVAFGAEGRSLPILLGGAVISGTAGVLVVQFIARRTRIPEDAAMGAVLSVFFGLGFVMLSYIQRLGTGAEGGIAKFIYGQSAAMSAMDATVIGIAALACAMATAGLFKEFRLVCFDPDFAQVQGWPVSRIDLLMMGLVVTVTVVGLQAVGLILIVALIVVPAAAARFWTERLWVMTLVAGGIGAASGYVGAALSALLPRFPTGGVIVLVTGAFFLISLFLAPRRGVLAGTIRQARLRLETEGETLLRALVEAAEASGRPLGQPVRLESLRAARSWPVLWRAAILARLGLAGLIAREGDAVRLTAAGARTACGLVRDQRLWEAVLAARPHVAPASLDQAQDLAAQGIDRDLLASLEARLRAAGRFPVAEV